MIRARIGPSALSTILGSLAASLLLEKAARESGKHVETRDVMVIAGGDPGERHKQSFDGKLRLRRREIVRRPRQVARMPARPTRQCDGLVVEPGIYPGLTVKKCSKISFAATG